MKCYATSRSDEIINFAASWTELEELVLSEVSKKDKDKYQMFSMVCDRKKHMSREQKVSKERKQWL